MDLEVTDRDLEDAIERIGRTADGRRLYLFLQKRLMAVLPNGALQISGALLIDHGERRFAGTLIGLMAQGIEDSAGRTESAGSSSAGIAERPIVFAVRGSAAVTSARGPARRGQLPGGTVGEG